MSQEKKSDDLNIILVPPGRRKLKLKRQIGKSSLWKTKLEPTLVAIRKRNQNTEGKVSFFSLPFFVKYQLFKTLVTSKNFKSLEGKYQKTIYFVKLKGQYLQATSFHTLM